MVNYTFAMIYSYYPK
jgi:hypothetical protein